MPLWKGALSKTTISRKKKNKQTKKTLDHSQEKFFPLY